MAQITGRKGGSSKTRTPSEAPDSLHSVATAKILLALGEGECAGGITDKDIYLDGTPIRAADGTLNFEGVTWEHRTGTQAQEYIKGLPAVENEITVSTELKASQPWTRAISNTQLSAVRIRLGVPMLQSQSDNGDINGYRVEYQIQLSTDGGGYQTVVNAAFDGKTTSLYERSHRIDLPAALTGWQVRVVRTTPDSTTSRIQCTTNVEAISEVIDAKLRYPHTELLFVTFDAKLFSNIPAISVLAPGRVIRVPTTYNPTTREYSGTWDGSFKWAYSNNPAWVFYDLLLNSRFGLGDRIDASQVDKWELYRIAQYCDQPVPDGRGGSGTEPRFLCDVLIQSQQDAHTVLNDLAAIFRGMTYWANGQAVALADMPRDMTYVYTRANVINGEFSYSGGSEKNRYSTAMVSWSNPDNHYSDEVHPVAETDLVRRYGVRQTSITAIGCTRETEADRRGRWVLLSNAKDRMVAFSTGLEGMIPLPGHIIGVADHLLSGRVIGGRLSAVNGRILTLDRVPDAVAGDRILVNLPSGESEARTVQTVNGNAVTVSLAFSEVPEAEAIWSIDAQDVAIQQYRVTSISDNGDGTYGISGVYHNPNKYDAIDTGARIDEAPISAIPPGSIAAPQNVEISSYNRVEQTLSIETMRVTWDAVPNAIAYECGWRKDNGDWITAARTSSRSFEISGIYAGRYIARVRAISANEISSQWSTSEEKTLTGKAGAPLPPVNFRTTSILWGVQLDWQFPASSADTLQTEVQISTSSTGEDAQLLTDVPYPQKTYQQQGLQPTASFFYRARLTDRLGNQSAWTEWVHGYPVDDAGEYLLNIDNQIKESDAWKELNADLESIQIDTEGFTQRADDAIARALANADANNRAFSVQRAQYGHALASIQRLDETTATEFEAVARSIEQLDASIGENTGRILNISEVIATNEEVTAQQMAQISAAVGQNTGKITDLSGVVATNESATAQKFTQVEASVDNVSGRVTTLNQTVVNNQTSNSQAIQQVKATADGAASAVQTNATAIASTNGKLAAQWGVKVQVEANGTKRVAGIQLGIDATGSSNFIVSADTFAVYNTTTQGSTLPFAITGGVVYLKTAMIQDGTIDTAKIASYIQSTNYVAGSAGWRIEKSGAAQFNNVTVRGTVYATNGSFTGTVNANAGTFNNVVINESCTVKKIFAENISGDILAVSSNASGYWGSMSANTNRHTICTFTGAPFKRVLMLLGSTGFHANGGASVTIRMDETTVYSRANLAGTVTGLENIQLVIPASSYSTTHTLTVQFGSVSSSLPAYMSFSGVFMLYRASDAVSIAAGITIS